MRLVAVERRNVLLLLLLLLLWVWLVHLRAEGCSPLGVAHCKVLVDQICCLGHQLVRDWRLRLTRWAIKVRLESNGLGLIAKVLCQEERAIRHGLLFTLMTALLLEQVA